MDDWNSLLRKVVEARHVEQFKAELDEVPEEICFLHCPMYTQCWTGLTGHGPRGLHKKGPPQKQKQHICPTRWSCRADASKAFVQGYPEIRNALAECGEKISDKYL